VGWGGVGWGGWGGVGWGGVGWGGVGWGGVGWGGVGWGGVGGVVGGPGGAGLHFGMVPTNTLVRHCLTSLRPRRLCLLPALRRDAPSLRRTEDSEADSPGAGKRRQNNTLAASTSAKNVRKNHRRLRFKFGGLWGRGTIH
jgi:hypothetical protein